MRPATRTPLEIFERMYTAHGDPWRYESSVYEAEKYARTLAALPRARYVRGLEVGCSIGVFTAELAARCDALVALEPSPTALARARERLADCDNVEFQLGAVPEQLPDGPFDLVVCSEVLFYLDETSLLRTLSGIESRLTADGSLIAVHFRPAPRRSAAALRRLAQGLLWRRGAPSPQTPLSGDDVHNLLRAHTHLHLSHEELEARWRLDRFDRVGGSR